MRLVEWMVLLETRKAPFKSFSWNEVPLKVDCRLLYKVSACYMALRVSMAHTDQKPEKMNEKYSLPTLRSVNDVTEGITQESPMITQESPMGAS